VRPRVELTDGAMMADSAAAGALASPGLSGRKNSTALPWW
jgi:hypothetical protein